VNVTKRALIDTLGVAFAGSREPAARIITGFVRKIQSQPVSGVMGGKIRVSSPDAAQANDTMAHALDL
jgi:2-methylcitrate dehydratase PrpD